ncbi:MAG: beta-galactosidase trimerization domain-containing protein [Clostridia bacterium]|nr:beta-galactosidase trimerization domain-containing protein [Clostridia bacterium]
MKDWFYHSAVRSLVDMHIPNGDGYMDSFDPAVFAENMKRSGATAAYVDACSCLGLCYYPTDVGLRHRAAERDIFGKTVEECRKRGLAVIAKTNTWSTGQSDLHPEWDVVGADGKRRRDKSRFGCPCINNDDFVALVCAHVKELVQRYSPDGVWIDMIGISAPVCFCESCRKKFGKPLPETIDPDDPNFFEYLRFKADSVAKYLEAVRAAAKEADPDVTVAFQTAAARHPLKYGLNDDRCYSLSDYLAGDFYTDRAGVNTVCRMLYKLSDRLPFEFMTSRCVSLERHTMNKNLSELITQAFASMMYKGSFLFIDAVDPAGTLNADFYSMIPEIKKNLSKYEKYVDYSERPVREVAVYTNYLSWLSPDDFYKPVSKMDGFYLYDRVSTLGTALSEKHIDFDILGEKNLGELKNYKVVILPGLTFISEKEAEALKDYAAQGGAVYASGMTSLRNENGETDGNFILSDLFGVKREGDFGISPGYLAPAGAEDALFGSHTAKYPHQLDEKLQKVVPVSEGKVLATVTLPVGDSSDRLVFSSAISDPPMVPTNYPAIFLNEYGKGKVIYSAGRIENDSLEESKELFAALIKKLVGKRRVTLDAPSCVDYTVYEKGDILKLHLLNHQSLCPPVRINEVKATLDLGGKTLLSVEDVSGGRLDWKLDGDLLTLYSDLDVYKLIIVKTK